MALISSREVGGPATVVNASARRATRDACGEQVLLHQQVLGAKWAPGHLPAPSRRRAPRFRQPAPWPRRRTRAASVRVWRPSRRRPPPLVAEGGARERRPVHDRLVGRVVLTDDLDAHTGVLDRLGEVALQRRPGLVDGPADLVQRTLVPSARSGPRRPGSLPAGGRGRAGTGPPPPAGPPARRATRPVRRSAGTPPGCPAGPIATIRSSRHQVRSAVASDRGPRCQAQPRSPGRSCRSAPGRCQVRSSPTTSSSPATDGIRNPISTSRSCSTGSGDLTCVWFRRTVARPPPARRRTSSRPPASAEPGRRAGRGTARGRGSVPGTSRAGRRRRGGGRPCTGPPRCS